MRKEGREKTKSLGIQLASIDFPFVSSTNVKPTQPIIGAAAAAEKQYQTDSEIVSWRVVFGHGSKIIRQLLIA